MGRRVLVVVVSALAALLVGSAIAVALVLLEGGSAPPVVADATPVVAEAAAEWPGVLRADQAGADVATLDTDVESSLSWSDDADTAPGWADIKRVAITALQQWQLELALEPPRRDALTQAGQVLAFGFVMDTNADGVADYVVGIDTDAEAPAVHVWLTNVATGETNERSSGPYGAPFDFWTSFEAESIPDSPRLTPGGGFFNVGFAPPELFDQKSTRFYAWTSLTEDGEVVAWDYAPDRGWLGAPEVDRLGCTVLACPMIGPAPGDGARRWIVSVENASARDAHLFVARDASPMGDLVGKASPASVAAGTTRDVVFDVPAGSGWAIFVNPSPSLGPLILAQDVPMDASGVLPITIHVQPAGSAVVSGPNAPGWFGN